MKNIRLIAQYYDKSTGEILEESVVKDEKTQELKL